MFKVNLKLFVMLIRLYSVKKTEVFVEYLSLELSQSLGDFLEVDLVLLFWNFFSISCFQTVIVLSSTLNSLDQPLQRILLRLFKRPVNIKIVASLQLSQQHIYSPKIRLSKQYDQEEQILVIPSWFEHFLLYKMFIQVFTHISVSFSFFKRRFNNLDKYLGELKKLVSGQTCFSVFLV